MATDMETLQKQVTEVEARLTTLKRSVIEMETVQNTIVSSHFCDETEVQKYEQVVCHIQQVANEVRGMLVKMEQCTTTNATSALHKIKTQQLKRLSNNLAATTNKFIKGRADYMEKINNSIHTQVEVSKGKNDPSEEEMKEILLKDSYRLSAFTQDFISENEDAKSQLRQIEDQQKEILALEKSVFELNQLFRDMSLLVNDHGQVLDSIETHVSSSARSIKKGKNMVPGNIRKTKKKQGNSNKFKMCLAVFVIVVVAIAVLVVAILLIP